MSKAIYLGNIAAKKKADNINFEQATIMFGQKQWAVTPGQSVVVYESNICLGGGFIKEAINQ